MNFYKDIILTFDLDWCSDNILEFTLEILEKYGENNTKIIFFVTHKTHLLEYIKKKYEVGIHPNFNFLLIGDFRYGNNIRQVIKYYKKLVPDSVNVRSHSLTVSSNILSVFKDVGFKYSYNVFIPFSSGIEIKPYRLFNGIIEYPHFWEDDAHCYYGWKWDVEQFLNYSGLKVFDFHPIHVFLNTENLERYNEAKPFLNDYKKLKGFVNNETYGTRNFLIDLIKGIKK